MIVELGQKRVTWLGPVPLKSGFHTQAGCAAAIGRRPDQAGSNLPRTERGQPDRNLHFYGLSRLPLFLWQKWSFVLFLIMFPAFKQNLVTAYPVTAMPGTWNNSACMGAAIPQAKQGATTLLPSAVQGTQAAYSARQALLSPQVLPRHFTEWKRAHFALPQITGALENRKEMEFF